MNPYEVLGISPDATPEEVKSAYRRAAKEHHPDRNGDSPESLEKFRAIQEAYESITKPRAQQHQHSSRFEDHPFSWAFSEFAQRTRTNFDHQAIARITLEQAYSGHEITANIDGRLITIRVPRGVQSGQRLRVDGEGSREHADLPPGNLYVLIEVVRHPVYEVAGIHLQKTVEIDMIDLMVGCEIETETLSGEVMKVIVPPRTAPTTKLRVKGKGMPTNNDQYGELYLAIKPILPQLSDDELERLKQLRS